MIRVGHGYDVHKFGNTGSATFIMLGGIQVPYDRELIAHSDGDVLLHALCDALLGASALGDIGKHFPDTSDKYKDINSGILLKEVYSKVTTMNFQISNIDVTVIAQNPKLAPYIEIIRTNIEKLLSLQPGQVNIKATTTESLGFIGRNEGIAVHSVVLISDHD